MSEKPKPGEPPITVLVADDDPDLRPLLQYVLDQAGFKTITACNGQEDCEKLTEEVSVAVLDVMMPEMGGMDCLDYFLEHVRHVQVILMTGTSKANPARMAVEAMKRGAFDYVSKPIDTDELIELIKHAARSVQLDREVRSLRRSISAPSSQVAFLGASDKTRDFIKQAEKIASLDSTALITGESGVGKGLLARVIHQASPRANGPFVQINCSALPRA